MNGDVEAHEFPEVFIFEAKLVGVVCAVIECCVSCGYLRVVSVLVVEDDSTDSRSFSADIKCIFKC